MPLLDIRHSSAGPKRSRKSHRKSKGGCLSCKRRKIKCNEEKPHCSNCVKYSDQCSFSQPSHSSSTSSELHASLIHPGLSSQSISPTSISDTPFPGPSEIPPCDGSPNTLLNITDLELLHNYNTSTSYTLSSISGLQSFFRVNIPRIGFSHPFLLHGILATSAIHLSHFSNGDLHTHYVKQAEHHYEIALRTATSLLCDINEDTCPALYLFGTFCHIITLGMGPKPGDFLLFGERGMAEWLLLFRGMNSILDTNRDLLHHKDLAPLFQISIRHVNQQQPSGNEHLRELRELIVANASKDPDLQLYLKALEDLSKSFPAVSMPGIRAVQLSPQAVFVWLYRISDDFVQLLQRRRPIPLVILTYFCVLLNDLGSFWWTKGWAEHLLLEASVSLEEEYRMWIRWPMEEIGWLPS